MGQIKTFTDLYLTLFASFRWTLSRRTTNEKQRHTTWAWRDGGLTEVNQHQNIYKHLFRPTEHNPTLGTN